MKALLMREVEKKTSKATSDLYSKPLFLDREQKRKIFTSRIRTIGRAFEVIDWLVILVCAYFFLYFYPFRFEPAFLLIVLLALVQSLFFHRLIFYKLSGKHPHVAFDIDISFFLLMLLSLAQLCGGISSPIAFVYVIILVAASFMLSPYAAIVSLFLEFIIVNFSVQFDPRQADFVARHPDLFIWEIVLLSVSAILFFVLSSIYFKQRQEKEKLEIFANQLTAERGKSDAVLQSMSDGVFVVDSAKRLIFINEAAQKLLQITPEQKDRFIGHFYGNVFKFKVGDKNLDYTKECPVQLAMAEAKPNFRKDLTLLNAFKKPIFITLSTAPVIDAAGDARGAVAIVRDTTKEREIERMQMEFVSIASHELLTPITQVQGHLSMIVDENIGKIDDTASQLVGNAYKGIKRISRLVKDLLNISRIERGAMKVIPINFNIEGFIDNLVKDFKDEVESNGLTITFAKPKKTIPAVFADADRLNEVLTNLVGNAIKFTKKGGITIGALERKDEFLVVFVKDTGIGIPKEDINKLFNKFYQVDSSATREAQGTGLGLYISKIIVEMMGGKIWVESKLKQGSTFFFSVPKAKIPTNNNPAEKQDSSSKKAAKK